MLRLLSFLSLAVFLTACSSFSSRMQDLKLGMSEDQVRSEWVSSYEVIATSINKDGKTVSGWKYQDSEKDPSYLVYFVDGKLAQFGEQNALRAIPELGNPHSRE